MPDDDSALGSEWGEEGYRNDLLQIQTDRRLQRPDRNMQYGPLEGSCFTEDCWLDYDSQTYTDLCQKVLSLLSSDFHNDSNPSVQACLFLAKLKVIHVTVKQETSSVTLEFGIAWAFVLRRLSVEDWYDLLTKQKFQSRVCASDICGNPYHALVEHADVVEERRQCRGAACHGYICQSTCYWHSPPCFELRGPGGDVLPDVGPPGSLHEAGPYPGPRMGDPYRPGPLGGPFTRISPRRQFDRRSSQLLNPKVRIWINATLDPLLALANDETTPIKALWLQDKMFVSYLTAEVQIVAERHFPEIGWPSLKDYDQGSRPVLNCRAWPDRCWFLVSQNAPRHLIVRLRWQGITWKISWTAALSFAARVYGPEHWFLFAFNQLEWSHLCGLNDCQNPLDGILESADQKRSRVECHRQCLDPNQPSDGCQNHESTIQCNTVALAALKAKTPWRRALSEESHCLEDLYDIRDRTKVSSDIPCCSISLEEL